MRNKNYRRHQENVHFKRRKKISVEKMHRYIENENGELIPDFNGKLNCSLIDHSCDNVADGEPGWGCRDRSLKQQKANENRRWLYQLKNGSIPVGSIGYSAHSWERRLCNRKLRHFMKTVDFILPAGRWLVRGDVSKGMPKPNYKMEDDEQ